jgi:hypothetical protein
MKGKNGMQIAVVRHAQSCFCRILGPLADSKVKCAKQLTDDDFVYFYSKRLDIEQLKLELDDADLTLHMVWLNPPAAISSTD